MASIKNVTVEDFKNLFPEFPYLPFYQEGKAYFLNDIVYNGTNFYISLIDANLRPLSDTTAWQLTNESIHNYVTDADILRAFAEARVNFNTSFWKDDEQAILVFLYLAAHFLVIDKRNAQSPWAFGSFGYVSSQTVGSVSESFGIPQWVLNDPLLGLYATTGFGQKYLTLILPFLVGNIILSRGATTFD